MVQCQYHFRFVRLVSTTTLRRGIFGLILISELSQTGIPFPCRDTEHNFSSAQRCPDSRRTLPLIHFQRYIFTAAVYGSCVRPVHPYGSTGTGVLDVDTLSRTSK